MTTSCRFAAILCAVGFAIASLPSKAGAASEPAAPAERFADFGNFPLRGGGVIRDFRLGYRTAGTLAADRSNAVLWPTWLDGKTQDQLGYVGPGKMLDTGKYFVILVDAIGDGVTTSPSNSKTQPLMDFPRFQIRDMVEAEYRLVTQVLGIKRLHAVVGTSMGGFQTFDWSVAHPDAMELALPMFGTPQPTAYDRLLHTAEIEAIELDPAWNGGRPTAAPERGLALAAMLDSLSSTTPAFRVRETPSAQFPQFLDGIKKDSLGGIGKAADHIRQRQACSAFDLPAEFGGTMAQAARRVRARMLVVVSRQDHAVNPAPALEFAADAGARTLVIDSDCGHLSIHCVPLVPLVGRFLADPGSVAGGVLAADKPR